MSEEFDYEERRKIRAQEDLAYQQRVTNQLLQQQAQESALKGERSQIEKLQKQLDKLEIQYVKEKDDDVRQVIQKQFNRIEQQISDINAAIEKRLRLKREEEERQQGLNTILIFILVIVLSIIVFGFFSYQSGIQ